jgi:DNA modification methylase
MSTSSFVPQRKNPSATNVAKRRALRMQELSAITVTLQPIARLKLDPKNPRVHSARQLRQIARSIESFGFNVPILVDSELKVIAGHGRVLAGLQLGLSEVPIIRLDHLSEAQARAFMIADNRLTENSAWDDALLAEQLKELSVLDLDFSLEATGFEMAEIDLRIEGTAAKSHEDEDPADTVPPITSLPALSRTGDLWQLGRHRVYCGNALDPRAFALLMDGEAAAVAFTDPPYNVKIEGHASGLGAVRHRDFAMASGEMDRSEFTGFLTRALHLHAHHSVDGAINFICMDWRHMAELMIAGEQVYSEFKNVCIWVKHNAGMGSLYRSQHELVFVFKRGRGSHRNNVQLGQYGRHRSNVWTYRGANCFGRGTDEGNLLDLHPTVKPVALVADAILDCSARGDVVLDGFLGSGTTIVAAERTGRRCFGIEINPIYVDTIIRRWQTFTGDNARHAETSRTFNELEADCEGRHAE